jgi:hypothetical protein
MGKRLVVAVIKGCLAIWIKAKPETVISNQRKLTLKHIQEQREESGSDDTKDTNEDLGT